jgi:3-oxoacyl-[acyl-carrier protein] reductase
MKKSRILVGKNALITGTSRGMGLEMVKLFAMHGANIWAHSRNENLELENFFSELSNTYKVRITPLYFDLADNESIKSGVKQLISTRESIDILVNNAGITYNALFQMSTLQKIEEVMKINFVAPFILTQYVVKLMQRNKKGTIINISSSAAIDANSGRSVYGASKAALICATKSLSKEVGTYGIRANVICPGITETDMISSMSEEVIRETVQETHMKRIGRPIDIANVALFLASDRSSYITGQIIRVDGGM